MRRKNPVLEGAPHEKELRSAVNTYTGLDGCTSTWNVLLTPSP